MDHEKMEEGIALFLQGMGVDVESQHLKGTPKRVAKAWIETFGKGYSMDPAKVLSTSFEEENYDAIVIVKDIPFCSMCAHHMLPFSGFAKIGYIPDKRVIGISKLARVLEVFSRRLQIQESITIEVAKAIQKHLKPLGVGVILEAVHLCMTERGVQKPGSMTVTSCMLGAMRDQADTRDEFLRL